MALLLCVSLRPQHRAFLPSSPQADNSDVVLPAACGPSPCGKPRGLTAPVLAGGAQRTTTQPRGPAGFAATLAALAALALRAAGRGPRQAAGAARARCAALFAPVRRDSEGALAGSTAVSVQEVLRFDGFSWSSVVRRSLKSCFTLYFKRARSPYGKRHQKNIRNRAYNIYHKNRYIKAMKRVLRYCVDVEFGEVQPGSLAAVMDEIKAKLDDACLTVDEVCVQGVLNPETAARRKDRMCRAVYRACMARGYIELCKDPFVPAYKVIGYDMPVCYKTREPRPWQLPGWKSPWMLKKEFDMWKKNKTEAAKEAANANA